MNGKEYVGDLNGGSLLVQDARIIAELIAQQATEEQFEQAVVYDNVLQRNSLHTAKRTAATLKRRLLPLGPDFARQVARAAGSEYRQLLMAALINHSPVVGDFLTMVLADRRAVFIDDLPKSTWFEFFDNQCRVYQGLDSLAENTVEKMGKNIFRALAEAGYLNSVRGKKIQSVLLAPSVSLLIEQHAQARVLKAMEAMQ